MDARVLLEYQWPYLLSLLPASEVLDRTAVERQALRRRRAVESPEMLLRLMFAYSLCGLSLRQTAAWAGAAGLASLSDVALLKRFRAGADWIGEVLAIKLAERTVPPYCPFRLRLIDATSISRGGSAGTDWRVHLSFDLQRLAIDDVELTDAKGGETLTRFHFSPREVVLADRGYAHRRGLSAVRRADGHFIVRINWQNLPLRHPDKRPFDVLAQLRQLPEAQPLSFPVLVQADRHHGIAEFPARLVAIRNSEPAAERARLRALREHSRKSKTPDPRTLEACGYIMTLTSLPAEQVSAAEVLHLYRFRWQIELAFKRLKSILHLGVMPAKDRALARAAIYSKLLAALVLDDFTRRFLAISPWGYHLR